MINFSHRLLSFFKVSYSALAIILLMMSAANGESAKSILDKGWAEFIRDNDTEAFQLFNQAYQQALTEGDSEIVAKSLLQMGICTYSVSYVEGLDYAMRAMKMYEGFEKTDKQKALIGRSKCLQLISAIKSRQGKYDEAISLSKEAYEGIDEHTEDGYAGIIMNSLGVSYAKINRVDSSDYYFRKALEIRIANKDSVYLPVSYSNVAGIEMRNGNKETSIVYYALALSIAEKTGNRQEIVDANIGIGNWQLAFNGRDADATAAFEKALDISASLSDRSFYIKALEAMTAFQKQKANYAAALSYEEKIRTLNDSLYSWERQKIQKNLEVQFNVSEKERQLRMAQKEQAISKLTNYLLWATIAFILLLAGSVIFFIRRNHNRDRLLLKTKEELMVAQEEQKKLKEQQLQNEIEFKESQLSAMTVQMLRKNELMQELMEKLEADQSISKDNQVAKVIGKAQNQEKDWADFNAQFESVNKNFYTRLKAAYPDISPNDLKICALIKLNLSIKEMAAILNISPDSVKTARYRLRKKLQLNTEDNLTEFILSL